MEQVPYIILMKEQCNLWPGMREGGGGGGWLVLSNVSLLWPGRRGREWLVLSNVNLLWPGMRSRG